MLFANIIRSIPKWYSSLLHLCWHKHCRLNMIRICHLRFWQSAPLYPGAQWHLLSPTQTPPFRHRGRHFGALHNEPATKHSQPNAGLCNETQYDATWDDATWCNMRHDATWCNMRPDATWCNVRTQHDATWDMTQQDATWDTTQHDAICYCMH